MNTPIVLATTFTLMLVGCDATATLGTDPRRAGTSSETQTSLQAFADSVSQVQLLGGETVIAARQMTPQGTTTSSSYIDYSSLSGFRQEDVFVQDELHTLRNNRAINENVEYRVSSLCNRDSMFPSQTGSGSTRAGFTFSFHDLTDEERIQLQYPIPTAETFMKGKQPPDVLFRLGSRWKVIVPGPFYIDSRENFLRVYQNDTLIGWMISKSSSRLFPVIDFGDYIVTDLDGNQYAPNFGMASGSWPYDSLGFYWGSPRADTNGRDLLLPYRWKFLAGTSRLLRKAHATKLPAIVFDNNGGPVAYTFSVDVTSDTGAAFARIPGGATALRSPYGWGAYIDGYRITYFDIESNSAITFGDRLDIPKLDP